MSDAGDANKHTLDCLRLAAECRNLAGDAATPEHARAHFLRMADMWTELAGLPPDAC